MARLKANANKLVECGEDIISLCDKYNEQIEIFLTYYMVLNKLYHK